MMDNKIKPKLRFPGFEGNWICAKFKEYVKLNQGLQIPITERLYEKVENSYFYITNEFLKNGSKKSYYILNPSKSVTCSEEDILMTRTGNTGKVITGVSGAFHNNFFKVAYKDNIEKKYLFYYLNHPRIQNIILTRAGASTIPDLNHSDFYTIEFIHPSVSEQKKIGDYLSTIDQKISLLEEKKAELSRFKKAVMQKLFSQELRFKDEKDDYFEKWENGAIHKYFKSYNGLIGKNKDHFGKGKAYIKYTQIFQNNKIEIEKCDFVEIFNGEKQNEVRFGDVFFTISSETPHEIGMASILLDNVKEVYLNSFCFGIRLIQEGVLLPIFYRYLFRSVFFRKEVVKLAQGSTRYNMSKVEFMKIIISIPSLPEQQKIADFLSTLDDRINKVEEQIQQTKLFKKAMLQQMFV